MYKTPAPTRSTRQRCRRFEHGGEYVIRGGKFMVVEGDWNPTRLVLLRFPDMAAAQALLDDPEYQPLKALRQRVAKTDLVILEAV